MTTGFFRWLLIAAASLVLASCASSQPQNTSSQPAVSSIPWDRPEKWEGQGGMMGGLGTP